MKRWLVVAVFLLGFLLRVVNLPSFPIGFTPDEASFGYDAYSLLKTGQDQWGNSLPLVFKSFGDYKSPLLGYLQVPFVAILGLNKLSVRLPNAILGSFMVLAVYLMVSEMFRKHFEDSWKLGLAASILVAISSWSVMLSRGAFEANLTTFFLPFGIWLFLLGLKKPKYFIYSAIIFGLNLFTYHSAKLVTPLVYISLLFFYRKEIKELGIKKILPSAAIFSLFILLTLYTFSLGAGSRVSERSIYEGSLEEAAKIKIANIQKGGSPILERLLHNKYQMTALRFINNYKQYFSFKFLFSEGPRETTYGMLPGRGVLYWFELPFIIGIIISLLRRKEKILYLLLFWLLIGPIPAALSTGVGYSANRAAVMMPFINILLALGAYELFKFIQKQFDKKISKYLLIGYALVALFFVYGFVKSYFVDSPKVVAKGMLYGNLEVAKWINENAGGVNKIVVDKGISEPHIYFAFAEELDPKVYQGFAKTWDMGKADVNWVDQIPTYKLGRFTFQTVEKKKHAWESGTLYIGKDEIFPETLGRRETFLYPGGEKGISVVEIK
jgi:4-amino-4-deoxy-L-arabinose transferase-like glycosyltransferase